MKYTSTVILPESIAGRKYFGFINLENNNPQAQEIGQKELASLCRAMGVDGADDTDELHHISYTAKFGMGKPSKKKNADGTPQYPAKVEVKRYYFPDEGNVPEPTIDEVQPVIAKATAANDNKPTAAARPAGSKPWK